MTWTLPTPSNYPIYDRFKAFTFPLGPCEGCENGVAIGVATIKVTMFGRDDQLINICRDCRTLARENTKQFMENIEKRKQS